MINKKRLITLCQRLINIDSQNPPGDEADIALYVKGYLNKLGVKAQSHTFKKRRSNIVAVIKGRSPKRSLLITPHLDTVCHGKGWRFPPLAGKLEGKKIYGLGATDCKCNLAVSLEVINSLAQQRHILDYNLIFAATADEESGSGWGLIPLLDKKILRAHAALVLDADAFSIVVAQKGLIHLKVKLKGRRAHGAYPWLGKNAISLAARIIRDLEAQAFSCQKNRFLRPPTVNTGTIRGGDKVNVVADWCEVEFDFRFLPKTEAKEILAAFKAVLRRHTQRFTIEIEGIQEPYEIDPCHPLVAHLAQAMRSFKVAPRISGSEGATTITFFQHQGIPAVATGFGVEGCAHAINEYVTVDNLYKGALVLEEFLKKYKF